MINVERLKKKPRHFHNFTGLTPEQFDELYARVEKAFGLLERERLGRKERRRNIGGGRKYQLALKERLLVTLMYYRLYTTQVLLSYLFNLDVSNLSRAINRLREVLLEVLPLPVQEQLLFAKPVTGRIASLEELLERHPEFKEVLIDATEQEIQKPKNKAKRKERYSGKKKRHTLKTQLTTSKTGLILHLSREVAGKVSDLHLLRATGVMHHLPQAVKVGFDRGYEGIENEYPNVNIIKPLKAKRNQPLNVLEKICNQTISTWRISVEHALGHLKRFKLLAGVYRGPDKSYDDTFLAIAGLHNFRKLGSLTW